MLNGDSESDDEDERHGRHESITHFAANGAAVANSRDGGRARKPQGPLVIESLPDRDWRGEIKTKTPGSRLLQPPGAAPGRNAESRETERSDGDKPAKWGLNLKEKKAKSEQGQAQDATPGRGDEPDTNDEDEKPKSADQEALDALTGNPEDEAKKRRLVISSATDAHDSSQVTEDDAYQRDVRDVGIDNTLNDYDEVPVEEFGAALLRGMGWDGKERGAKRREVKNRQNLLGLGAKQLKEAEELGAWTQKGRRDPARRPRLNEYRREDEERRNRRDVGRGDSYKSERDREQERSRMDAPRHRQREYRH